MHVAVGPLGEERVEEIRGLGLRTGRSVGWGISAPTAAGHITLCMLAAEPLRRKSAAKGITELRCDRFASQRAPAAMLRITSPQD